MLWCFSEINDESTLFKIYQENICEDYQFDPAYFQNLKQLVLKLDISHRVEFLIDSLPMNFDNSIYLSPQLYTCSHQREKSQSYCEQAIMGISTSYFLQNSIQEKWLILPVIKSSMGNFVDPKFLRIALDQKLIAKERSLDLPKRFQLSPWIEEKNNLIVIQDLIYGKIEIENNDDAFTSLYQLGHLSDIAN
jgi:hypothetical protein